MAIALEPTYVLDQLAAEEPRPGMPFAFTGRGGEYFGIWIVNLLLSIVTLGIYSAWAKVRTKRYFYGNTRLASSTFDYLATPIQILKGRLIAFAFFVAYAATTHDLADKHLAVPGPDVPDHTLGDRARGAPSTPITPVIEMSASALRAALARPSSSTFSGR